MCCDNLHFPVWFLVLGKKLPPKPNQKTPTIIKKPNPQKKKYYLPCLLLYKALEVT